MLAAGVTAGKVSAHDHGGGSSSPLFEKTGNFDLTNPVDLLLARTKAVTCLAGNRTHIYMMSRHMLAEPGKEVIQLLAELELMTIWLTPSPDGAANKALIGFLSEVFGVPKSAISIELGVHNTTLAMAVAAMVAPAMIIPAAVYNVFMFFTAGAFAKWMHSRNT